MGGWSNYLILLLLPRRKSQRVQNKFVRIFSVYTSGEGKVEQVFHPFEKKGPLMMHEGGRQQLHTHVRCPCADVHNFASFAAKKENEIAPFASSNAKNPIRYENKAALLLQQRLYRV